MVEALCQQNEVLQDSVQVLKTQTVQDRDIKEETLDYKPLSEAIWDDQLPENFKPSSLMSFNGKTDPREHIIAINSQISIVGGFLFTQM